MTTTTTTHAPQVQQFMTREPCAVDCDLTLEDATDRMKANNLRHLLVLDAEHLVGVVSLTNLNMALAASSGRKGQLVRAAVHAVHACRPETPLYEVARAMEAEHLDCTVVVDLEGNAVGIFTATDALRALRAVLVGHPVEAQIHPTHLQEPGPHASHVSRRIRVKRLVSSAGASPTTSDGMTFGKVF